MGKDRGVSHVVVEFDSFRKVALGRLGKLE